MSACHGRSYSHPALQRPLPWGPTSGAHLPLGAISFSYLSEKWHLPKILRHATAGWDLDSSLENNSRLCGSLSTAGQYGLCCQWQGAIRWQIPQTGSSPVARIRDRLGVSPDKPTGIGSVFPLTTSRVFHLTPGFWVPVRILCAWKNSHWGVGEACTRGESPSTRDLSVCYRESLPPHSDQLFWKFSSYLFCFSFLVCKKPDRFLTLQKPNLC